MLIDWFTVVAQIVNFLILMALLKIFLYDRIVRAMDEREERIRSRLQEAEQRKEEAAREQEEFRDKNRELEERRQELLTQAKEEAAGKRKELIQQARKEVEGLKKRWQDGIQRGKQGFLHDLRRLASQQVYGVARRSLRDLADADIQEHIVDVFLRRLKGMKHEEKKRMADLLEKSKNQMVVRSAFELSSAARQKVTRALHEHIAHEVNVSYQTVPDLVLGVELKVGGGKLAWSLVDYLDDLEERVSEALEAETQEAEKGHEETDANRS